MLADAVVIIHAAYVGFVVFGLAAILIGVALEWDWVRGFCFRLSHLVAIALVCLEAILGVMCPLTTLRTRCVREQDRRATQVTSSVTGRTA